MFRRFLAWTLCFWILAWLPPALLAAGKARHFVVMVWDGMRPDFISAELTPTLLALRSEGVWFANHHSVYPTSTEVNGTVLATGNYPQRNGITANKEYRREIDPLNVYETQSPRAVRRGDEITGDKYITVPTLAELLQERGFNTAIVGAKGVALLHDRRARGDHAPGLVWFAEGCLPELMIASLTNRFGSFPVAASPNLGRDEWATRCLTEAFWERGLPRYSLLWLSEPDYSQHHHGPGSPQALEAIRNCDRRLAAVLYELGRRGARDQTDVIVVSDHGFSTIDKQVDVAATLRAAGINARTDSNQPPADGDIVVASNGGSSLVYAIGHSPRLIEQAVTNLQRQTFSGIIFTRDARPGTLPLAEAKIATATAPDIVVSMRWTASPPEGAPAISRVFSDGYTQYKSGMHVTLSPLDLRNIAVANGPDFRRGVTDSLPSGNVDIVPTLLWLMDLEPSAPLDGRVLGEALTVAAPPLGDAKPGRRDARVEFSDGLWEQYLKFTELNGVRYLEEGNGHWTPRTAKDETSTPAGKQ